MLGFLLFAAAASADVRDAARTLEQSTTPLRPDLRQAYRLSAAASLRKQYPELSRRFVDLTMTEARETGDLTPPAVRKLAELAPDDAVALLPYLKPGSDGQLLNELVYAKQTDAAVKLFRAMLVRRDLPMFQANPLLGQLAKDRPADAVELYREILAAFPFHSHTPERAWALMNCVATMSTLAPGRSADAAERLARTALNPEYGKGAAQKLTYAFELGGKAITTTDPREMVLLMSGARLHELAPDRFRKLGSVFAAWKFDGPLTVKGTRRLAIVTPEPAFVVPKLRAVADDAERAKLAIEAAERILALPGGDRKTNAARDLANLVTEGDLGAEALNAVARALAVSLRESSGSDSDYLEIATLIRYEQAKVPDPEPAVGAADALLGLREQIHTQSGFTLTGIDGKEYTLDALRGKVVLLNFWATWCPPCRKEMPDLDKLYRELASKGLVILAASDEDRETVAKFADEKKYAFPIVLDPGRKTHDAFDIVGIPNTYLFDRAGRLAAQAMDMRTERQFREMLKRVGLE